MTSWSLEDLRARPKGTSTWFSLKSYGYGISLIGGVDGLAAKRGENRVIPFRTGRPHSPKVVDQGEKQLVMWVDGRNTDGSYPVGRAARRARLNANVQELLGIFGATAENDAGDEVSVLIELQRDVLWPDGSGGSVTQQWTAECEVTVAVPFESDEDQDDQRGLSVDLVFPDPYWYYDSGSGPVRRF